MTSYAIVSVVDTTPPTVNASVTPEPNATGWHGSEVTVTLSAADAGLTRIHYSATGAQTLHTTVVAGNTAAVVLNTDGSTTLTFHATDYTGNAAPEQTLTLNLNLTPPVAQDQTVTLDEDSSREVVLTATDPGVGDPLTYSVVDQPQHGTLTGTAPNLTYAPAQDYAGPDSFTFKANDGTHDSAPATVSLTVTNLQDPPTAQNGSAVTYRDRSADVTLSAGDIDGDPLTYTIITPPEHGVLTGTAPNLLYTPDQGYTGSDQFTFTANDGQADSTPATVSLNILLPLLTLGSATAEPGEDATLPIHLTEAATDVAGIELTLQAVGPDGAPALRPTFHTTAATDGWTVAQNPSFPWRINLIASSPLAGPAEILRLQLGTVSETPIGTSYRIEVAAATLINSQGSETDVTALSAPGALVVAPCEVREKGDVNGDGAIDIRDAIFTLRTTVELDIPSNECAFVAADVNCTGSISVADAVLILRKIVFDEAFPCP